MKLTKKVLIGTGMLAAIAAFVLSSGGPVLAAPPDKDVIVVNTPAQPVPVAGTVSVTGATTVSGTVNAAQSGPWTVGIDPANNLVSLAPGGSLYFNPGATIIGGAGTVLNFGPFDLSSMSTLRIIARAFNNNGGDIKFEVLAWDARDTLGTLPYRYSIPFDEFSLNEATDSRVYEAPPPSVVVRLTHLGGTGANYHLVLIGR